MQKPEPLRSCPARTAAWPPRLPEDLRGLPLGLLKGESDEGGLLEVFDQAAAHVFKELIQKSTTATVALKQFQE